MGRCPDCNAHLQVELFPALLREAPPAMPAEKLIESEAAACFYHPDKRAVDHCSGCGRFLCALCDVAFDERHICPVCLTGAKKSGKIKNLENRRFLYGNLSWVLAFYPMIFVFPTLITAPLSVFVAVRYWKVPRGVVSRTRIRHVLAVVLASMQITGWILFFHDIVA